jgi:WD40 repeat protein
MFFVSASDDKTVKVWDTARLERNVTSKPRHSYSQHHAKVKCVCMLEGVHCFASAAEDGSIHVVKVNASQTGTLPKYGKLQAVREHRLENVGEYVTCMMHFNSGMFHFPISRGPKILFFSGIRCIVQSYLRHNPLFHLHTGSANDASPGNNGESKTLRIYHLSVC